MPKVESLSPKEAVLVRELSQNAGLSIAEAGRRAGYAYPQSASEAIHKPRVAEHLLQARTKSASKTRTTLEKLVRSVDMLSTQVESDIEAEKFTEIERAQLLTALSKVVPDLLALQNDLGVREHSPQEARRWLRAKEQRAFMRGVRLGVRHAAAAERVFAAHGQAPSAEVAI
jgi:hypothetical protein